jgi:hypothetical protein
MHKNCATEKWILYGRKTLYILVLIALGGGGGGMAN